MGADVCLISGPTKLEKPKNIKKFIKVKTAYEMLKECETKIYLKIYL